MIYNAFAESTEIVESEFFRRELGLLINPFMNLRSKREIPGSLILMLNSPSEILNEVLKIESSLIVFVLGDEKYQSDLLYKLSSAENVVRIYTPYFPNKPRISMISRMLMGTLLDGGISFRTPAGGIWRTLLNGYRKWNSTANFSELIKVHKIPLGYTNRFVEELISLGVILKDSSSLFKRAPLDSSILRRNEISFVGTRDSWCRDLAISHLRNAVEVKSKYAYISVDPKWGGGSKQGGIEYCSSLIESRATLCPPGYSSNFTFRFWESMLLGAFPVSLPLSAQDWHLWQPTSWNYVAKSLRAYSWRNQVSRSFEETSEQTTNNSLIASALREGCSQLHLTRQFLEASIGL
jgi:hypothetical protein